MDEKKILDQAWAKEQKIKADKAKEIADNKLAMDRQNIKEWKNMEAHVKDHEVERRLNDIIDWYKAKCEEIFPGTDLHYEKLELKRTKGTMPPPYESATFVYDIGAYLSSDTEFSVKLQIICNCQFWWFVEEKEFYEESYDPDDEEGLYLADVEQTEDMFGLVRDYFIDQLKLVEENKDFYNNPLKYT